MPCVAAGKLAAHAVPHGLQNRRRLHALTVRVMLTVRVVLSIHVVLTVRAMMIVDSVLTVCVMLTARMVLTVQVVLTVHLMFPQVLNTRGCQLHRQWLHSHTTPWCLPDGQSYCWPRQPPR
jgi:Zn-dependent membrane protease YugP